MKFKLITLLALLISFNATARNLDSLTMVLATNDSVEVLAKTNIEIGKYYTNRRHDSAMYFYTNAIEFANRASNKTLLATVYMGITEFLRVVKEDNEKAYLMAVKATGLIRSAGNEPQLLTKYQGMTYTYGGVYQMELGNYTEAQEFFLKSITEIEKVNQPRALVSIKNQLFVLYYTQGMIQEAKVIVNECIDLCVENDWYYEHISFLTNKAAIETSEENHEQSILTLKEVIQLIYDNSDTQNYHSLGNAMNNIGFNYFELEQYDSSYVYHMNALSNMRKINDLSGLVISYGSLCQDCAQLGEFKRARFYCDSMQVGIDTLNRPNLKTNSLVAWINYYNLVGEHEKAFEKMDALMAYKEELINEQNIQDQTAQKMEFEFEKERAIGEKILLLRNEKIATEKAYNDKLFLGLILVTVLSASLLFVIYSNFKKRRIISRQNENLNNSVEEKETLLKEIHHRVKNNLQLVSSLLSLQSDTIDDEQVTSIFEEGQNRVQAMALIHQKLYQNDSASDIDFQDYISSLIQHFSDANAGQKEVEIKVECEDVRLDIDTAIPLGLIVNELFTNSFKHAFKNIDFPKLSISIKNLGSGEYNLKMTDNGQGLPSDLDWAKTKTLGLRLIRNLVKQLIGKINYENQENLSVFSIHFKNQLGRNLVD